MDGESYKHGARALETRVGIINRNASFGGGVYPSRSVSLRLLLPFKVAERISSVRWTLLPEDSDKIDYSGLDAVFFCRHSSEASLKIHEICKQYSIPTVYDIDDLVTGYPAYFQLGEDEMLVQGHILKHLAYADRITVENRDLLKSLPNDILSKACVIENAFSFDDYPLTKSLKCRNKKIIFTNAAGLKFDNFRKEFFQVLDTFCKQFGYEVHVFSDLGKNQFPLENMVYRGATSWEEHKKILAAECFDLAVVPLGGTDDSHLSEFNRCKSIIKFIEYAACGIPSIFSNELPYQERLTSYKNCILVNNTKSDWTQALTEIACNNKLNQEIRAYAYQEVKSNFDMKSTSEKLLHMLHKMITF